MTAPSPERGLPCWVWLVDVSHWHCSSWALGVGQPTPGPWHPSCLADPWHGVAGGGGALRAGGPDSGVVGKHSADSLGLHSTQRGSFILLPRPREVICASWCSRRVLAAWQLGASHLTPRLVVFLPGSDQNKFLPIRPFLWMPENRFWVIIFVGGSVVKDEKRSPVTQTVKLSLPSGHTAMKGSLEKFLHQAQLFNNACFVAPSSIVDFRTFMKKKISPHSPHHKIR